MSQLTNRSCRNAMVGVLAIGAAVAISSFSIVRAEHVSPDRTFSCSAGTACVEGSSTGSKTWGVYGIGTVKDGVHGVSSGYGASGVSGFSTASSGPSHGVFGVSASAEGVMGVSHAIGVGSYGVYGLNPGNGIGVFAESGATYPSLSIPALYATGDKIQTWLFEAYNRATKSHCDIDPSANLTCSGKIGGAALRAQHRNSSGQRLLTYASESATSTIEDVGTARMLGGLANVQIDPAFASLMDRKWYYVFLTPLGDTRGLYVSMKTPTGFQVRETAHGRSSLEFDYRIVAHPLDADNDRLPLAPAIRTLRAVPPSQQ